MVDANSARLRRLSAELIGDISRLAQTADEMRSAFDELRSPEASRLALYGAAALLDTFYSGIEKALARIAAALGGIPDGPAWHRTLLEDMTINLPEIRPPVLSLDVVKLLESYLAFRHRFRNLYLFDLEKSLLLPLMQRAPDVWAATEPELRDFADTLKQMSDRIDEGV